MREVAYFCWNLVSLQVTSKTLMQLSSLLHKKPFTVHGGHLLFLTDLTGFFPPEHGYSILHTPLCMDLEYRSHSS